MSKNDMLYVKGMNISESDHEEEEVDIWDDSKLNDAYDKALRIANAEVAMRVAMSTNTEPPSTSNQDDSNSKSSDSKQQSTTSQTEDIPQWQAGMHCRAVYEEDGVEYEALLLRIISENECLVRFLGYDNSEIVPIADLKQSLGKTARTEQIEEELVDKLENGNTTTTNHLPSAEKMDCNGRSLSPGSAASFEKSKKSGKKKNKKKQTGFEFPDVPLPNLSQLHNLGVMDMPIPPPPLGLRSEMDNEDQAISSMLLSWYMSGYYTGLYQGMKRAKEGRGSH